MTRFVATIGLSLVFLAVSQSFSYALAPTVTCGKREDMVKLLKNKYKEFLVSKGLIGNRGFMEVYASKGGKTWTILLTGTNGVSCTAAVGTAFDDIGSKPVEDPEA